MRRVDPTSARTRREQRQAVMGGFTGIQATLRRYRMYRYSFLMLVPVLLYYIIFQYGPIYGVQIAFRDFKILYGISQSPWVGFDNFSHLFEGMYFQRALRNTLIINTLKLLIGFPAPILLAVMLNDVRRLGLRKAFQTVSYMPYFLSWIVLAGVIIEFLSPSRGLLNQLLSLTGIRPVFFLGDKSWFRSVLVATDVWKSIGFNSIIYLAAIAAINPEIYDAADVDGINKVQKVWYVTLPSILPVIVIMMILSADRIINDDFDQVFNLLNGSVLEVGDVLSTYTYSEGVIRMNYSYAAAVGLFRNVIALALVLSTNFLAKRFSDETIF